MFKRDIVKEEKKYRKYEEFINFMGYTTYNPYLMMMGFNSSLSMFESMILESRFADIRNNRSKYKNSLEAYNNILVNFANLTKELELNNALSKSLLFSYLLWNGYLSYNNELKYDQYGIQTIPGLLSFDAINGRGLCLSFSHFLSDCLNASEVNAAAIMCSAPNKVTCDYLPKIERNMKTTFLNECMGKVANITLYPITKDINHVITLINEDDNIYGYDVTNLLVLNIDNELNAKVINGKGIYRLSPYKSLSISPLIDKNNIYNSLFNKNNNDFYSREEIINIIEHGLEVINKNILLIKKFYEGNIEYYKLIHNELLNNSNGMETKKRLHL